MSPVFGEPRGAIRPQVLVTWGEPGGGSRKPQVGRHEQTAIRATVAPAPFTAAVRERFRAAVGGR